MEKVTIKELKCLSEYTENISNIKNYLSVPKDVREFVLDMAKESISIDYFLYTYVNLNNDTINKNSKSFAEILYKGVKKITGRNSFALSNSTKNALIQYFSEYIKNLSKDEVSDIDSEFLEFEEAACCEYLEKVCKNSEMLKNFGAISDKKAEVTIEILNTIVSESYDKSLKWLMHGDDDNIKNDALNTLSALTEYFSYNSNPNLKDEDYIEIRNHIDLVLAHTSDIDILLNKDRINKFTYLENSKFARYILDEYRQLLRENDKKFADKIKQLVIKLSDEKYSDSVKSILEYYHTGKQDKQTTDAKIDCVLGCDDVDEKNLSMLTKYGIKTSINKIIKDATSIMDIKAILRSLPIDEDAAIGVDEEIYTYKFTNEDKKDE